MASEMLDQPLPLTPIGTRRFLRIHRFGDRAARPKAYIHGGLHADETPGMLAALHLVRRLEAADARGEMRGQVVVVPYANPIGLAQFANGEHLGRHDLSTGVNFNRGWPELAGPVADRVAGKLTDDPDANTEIIRAAMRTELEAYPALREIDVLRGMLAQEACDADLVMDLHCDDEALVHLFVMAPQWPQLRDLAGELGCRAVLFADGAGGSTFASSMYAPWPALAARFPEHEIPLACTSVTVELRGYADVDDRVADADAAALVRALQRRGYVDGDPGPPPNPVCEATPLDACDIVRAPAAGIVVYGAALGARVVRGDTVAEIVDPSAAPGASRRVVRAAATGVVLSRRLRRMVAAGEVIGKVAGSEPLAHRRGHLLED